MRIFKKSWILCLALIACSNCGSRAIFIEPGTAGKLAAPLKNVAVYVPDSTGALIQPTADLPAGTIVAVPKSKGSTP